MKKKREVSNMTGDKYAIVHKKIKSMAERMCKEANSTALIIPDLADELKMDCRVIRNHLRIMEIDGIGQFHNKGKKGTLPMIFILNTKGEEK
jgi:hypothetical protein